MTIVFAPLFSHETGESPESVFTESHSASAWADRVLAAQPGIEVELMVHRNRTEGWRSIDSEQTIREVRASRWQDPGAKDGASRD